MTLQFSQLPETPHYAKLAWQLNQAADISEAKQKGLNVWKVVAGAVELADQNGLDAVTIRSLSKHLGFTTMSIYRHVESREELLILMTEMSLGMAPLSQGETWQDAVTKWCSELFVQYRAHPWILDAPLDGMPTTPARISWVEQALEALRPCRLSYQRKLDVALLLDGHARHFVGIINETKKIEPESLTWLPEAIGKTSPLFAEAFSEGVLQDEEPLDFYFGLKVIINGIEQE